MSKIEWTERTLLATPAAVRFVSAEPLLGPIDFSAALLLSDQGKPLFFNPPRDHVDWIIVGGESGPNARPMHPEWARSIREQCFAAKVPFFFKQWGEWTSDLTYPGERRWLALDGFSCGALESETPLTACVLVGRVGKYRAGRVLDGRTWDGMPSTGGKVLA